MYIYKYICTYEQERFNAHITYERERGIKETLCVTHLFSYNGHLWILRAPPARAFWGLDSDGEVINSDVAANKGWRNHKFRSVITIWRTASNIKERENKHMKCFGKALIPPIISSLKGFRHWELL